MSSAFLLPIQTTTKPSAIHRKQLPQNCVCIFEHQHQISLCSRSPIHIIMSQGDDGFRKPVASVAYKKALELMSSLIIKRTRASLDGDRFDLMFDYVKILDLELSISQMKIIHVAGTKGKGSTCAFTESILRNCGFHTGLFTSPHLIDVRERFRLDGLDISEEKFLIWFWWCWNRLKEITDEKIPMPTLVRFLALLALKIFAVELVDVVILEVGLGGKFDATNVVQAPVVCGITSLGYDHMDILGNTLTDISREKAGIFKRGVPAITVFQPDEAMHVLEQTASNFDIHLEVVPSLDSNLLNGRHLALDGEHQFLNAALAVALCSTWLERTGHKDIAYRESSISLPKQFIMGLTTASLEGRGQILPDQQIDIEHTDDLVFYLDGAHSPESMDMCARWFCLAIKNGKHLQKSAEYDPVDVSGSLYGLVHDQHDGASSSKISLQILMFNCMSVRDPHLLLANLMNTCAIEGVHFRKALFVPNTSLLNKVGSIVPSNDSKIDVSWQRNLQRVWENLVHSKKFRGTDRGECIDEAEKCIENFENSMVFPSLPLAMKWLRDNVRQNHSFRFQVLVTGSLHLVGDVLKLLKNKG